MKLIAILTTFSNALTKNIEFDQQTKGGFLKPSFYTTQGDIKILNITNT